MPDTPWEILLSDPDLLASVEETVTRSFRKGETPALARIREGQWPAGLRIGSEEGKPDERILLVQRSRLGIAARKMAEASDIRLVEFESRDSLDQAVSGLVSSRQDRLPERDMPFSPGRLIWRVLASVILLVTLNAWFRFFDCAVQLPGIDWRVLQPDTVCLWAAPVIGIPAIILACRRRRNESRATLGWLALPLLSMMAFGAVFFLEGRIIDVESKDVLAQRWEMLVRTGDPSAWLRDGYRFMRPRFSGSPTVIPIISPWLTLGVSIACAVMLGRLAIAALRR